MTEVTEHTAQKVFRKLSIITATFPLLLLLLSLIIIFILIVPKYTKLELFWMIVTTVFNP